jgi:hypothetical protein
LLVPKYRIRWRYDWLDRASKCGMWSLTTKNEIDQAWNKQKENLMFASVEGKTPEGETVTLCQVAGQDFCFFQWMAVASAPALALVGSNRKPFTPVTKLIGIKLVTRYENISVFDTGHIFREPRSAEDQAYNYAAFGK